MPNFVIDTVIFDLGNVLIPWDRRFLYGQLIDDPEELDYFLDNVLTFEVNRRLDLGTPLPVVADDLAAQFPEYDELIVAFRERWSETTGPPLAESVEMLDQLRQTDVKLIALSNWGADTFATARPRYPFLEWFHGLVISGEELVAKPDREIFDRLCERYSVTPQRALFVDDSPTNIAAADALGFETHLFTEPGPLRVDLVERGLLPQ